MSYYFSHDYDALNDDKILQLRGEFGVEGYGLFWMCLETMAKNDDGYLIPSLIGGLSLGYGTTREKLAQFLDFCVNVKLFFLDENGYSSHRMQEHKNSINLLSVSGKKGAEKRWKNREANSTPNANKRKEKKRKEKKSKLIMSPKDDIEYSFENQLKKMFSNETDNRMPIIAFYWTVKEFKLDTEDAFKSALRRELRPAGFLKGYKNEQIKKTCHWLKENANFKWTLETVHKYIDENLDKMGNNGKPLTEDEIINQIAKKYV